jgi:hypothetical protein
VGIRQTLNRNPVLTSAIAAVIIIIIAATQLKRACSAPRPDESQDTTRKAYFTIDDGINWFPDDASKVPPFKYQGKDAYRVAVFRCAGGKPFVARLERFSEPTRKRLQDAVDANRGKDQAAPAGAPHMDMEVKRPGEKEWVRLSSKTAKEYTAVMEVRCPDGSSEGIEPVYPD